MTKAKYNSKIERNFFVGDILEEETASNFSFCWNTWYHNYAAVKSGDVNSHFYTRNFLQM